MTLNHRYGPAPSQQAQLYLPAGAGPFPVVVLVHGGFWLAEYGRSLMAPLARDLAARGYAALNISYRRVGEPGGGWPGTLADAAAAVDALAELATARPLDLDRVVSVGHSAGGHLALWLAARPRLPAGAPGAGPRVRLRAAVSLAGVVDLRAADAVQLGDGRHGAAAGLLGGRAAAVPERYEMASPRARLPLGVPQLLVHGDADELVPVTQSRDYAEAAKLAGDDVELLELPGIGHFEVIKPSHWSWTATVARLPRLLAG